MRWRDRLRYTFLMLRCAPLVTFPGFAATLLCEETIVPVSQFLFRLHLTTSYISSFRMDTSIQERALEYSIVATLLGVFAIGFMIALSAPFQLRPHRIRRAIDRAFKALLIGLVPVFVLSYIANVRMNPPGATNDFVNIAMLAIGPMSCLWIDAAIHRLHAWKKKREHQNRSRCLSCRYDLRGSQPSRCPECGAPCGRFIPLKSGSSQPV